MRNALDKQAELNDLEQQVRKRRPRRTPRVAADDSTLKQADSALQRAQLEMLKNDMLPKIQAEKNTLALEEAQAKLKQLQQTYDLKRARSAGRHPRPRDPSRPLRRRAMQEAASNAERMLIKSPIAGHRRDQVDVEGAQHGRDSGRRRSPFRPSRWSMSSNPSTMRGAREGEPGRHRRAARRPERARRPRRLSRPVVYRPDRPDLSHRRPVEPVSQGPQLHRPGRYRQARTRISCRT